MTVNARRSRRGSSAAAKAERDPDLTTEPAREPRPDPDRDAETSRASSSTGRVLAFPEPAGSAAASLPPQFLPAPTAPPVPREEPAVLHPSDRRSFGGSIARPTLAARPSVGEIAIGEIDQTLFDCPNCRRPLALGTRRCPGCGTRLIRSVILGKAALFVAVGLALGAVGGFGGGMAVGSGLTGAATTGALLAATSAPSASTAPTTSAPPVETATATATTEPVATPSPAGGSMPSVVRGALVQALALDDRLGAAEADLRAAVAAKPFDASGVAATMRTISAESVFGEGLAAPVAAWSDGSDLSASLATFYGTVHDTAVAALDNSVQNAPAYRAAARSMVALLAGRTTLDDAIRSAADAAGVSLPAPTAP